MTDKEYFADKEFLTNTMLGWILVSPQYFKKQISLLGLDKETTERYFVFGGAVHCRLLENKEFANRYFVSAANSPSNVVQKKFCTLLSVHKKIDDKSLVSAYKLSYSTEKMKEEDILKKAKELYETYSEYVSEQRNKGDKIELTSYEYDSILAIERNILFNARAKELLFSKNDTENNEFIIFFTFREIKFKSKIDRFIIDVENKTITIIDIKTHSPKREGSNLQKSFEKSFFEFNYDRQLYLYTTAVVSHFIEKYPEEDLSLYKIEQKIILIKANFDNEVLVINLDESILNSGEENFNKAFDMYNYYEANGYDKVFGLNSQGEITLFKK